MDDPRRTAAPRPADVARLLAGCAGLAASITVLFLSMRSVMDIGGACADGGPYVSANPCPENVALLMFAGMVGWFAFAALTVIAGGRIGRHYGWIGFLAWPALFISLGWNFLEYAFWPPGGGGIEIGWLICGVVFVLMGGIPLVGVVGAMRAGESAASRPEAVRLATIGRRSVPSPGGSSRAAIREAAQIPTEAAEDAGPSQVSGGPDATEELVSALERLASLHRAGALDDIEFEAAKRAVLETSSGTASGARP